MYESYWQLDKKPFNDSSPYGFYFPAEPHDGARSKLRYALQSGFAGALLAGPSGAGKTMMVHLLRSELPDHFDPFVHVVFPQLTGPELLAYLADELDPEGAAQLDRTAETSVRRMEQFLLANFHNGRRAVLVIDDAHVAAECGTLETIRLLMNFHVESQPAATVLLVGQTPILSAVERLPGLADRLGITAVIRALHEDETVGYIRHRLDQAGATRGLLDDTATTAVYEHTHGNPRQINQLCDLALLVGYAEKRDCVTAGDIAAVYGELIRVAAA